MIRIASGWQALKDLFVTHTCYGCERELTVQENCVCLNCLSQMTLTCFDQQPTENELFYRLAGKVPLEGATSLFYYDKEGRLQRLLEQLKYHRAPQLGIFLGEYFGSMLQESDLGKGVDVIVPVPLHPAKQWQRGYNQAEMLAQGLSNKLSIPVDTNILKRKLYTNTQTKKSRQARWENVKNAFVVRPHSYGTLLLVDDVVTTGATLEACIQQFIEVGNETPSIRLACLAMARRS